MDLSQTRYEIENGVATVTLNRPDKLNAFTPTMRNELIRIFAEADLDDAVRVIVVTGAGKAFCAGADLSSGGSTFDRDIREGRKVSMSEHRDGGGQVSLAVFRCRKPVIAAINGHAVGVGITVLFLRGGALFPRHVRPGFCPALWGYPRPRNLYIRGGCFRLRKKRTPACSIM